MPPVKPLPGQPMPAISLPVLSGGDRSLAQPRSEFDWQLVLVYRGKHCPLCTTYLKTLNGLVEELNQLGVDVLAVSADSQARAEAQMADVDPVFDVAYGLSTDQMRALGLYISGPKHGLDVEGAFAEPGLFITDETGQLRIVDISNVPFARPDLAMIVRGIRYLRGMSEPVPANGTYAV